MLQSDGFHHGYINHSTARLLRCTPLMHLIWWELRRLLCCLILTTRLAMSSSYHHLYAHPGPATKRRICMCSREVFTLRVGWTLSVWSFLHPPFDSRNNNRLHFIFRIKAKSNAVWSMILSSNLLINLYSFTLWRFFFSWICTSWWPSFSYYRTFQTCAPPGPGDKENSCPALNNLAHHHILPHDGRNLTVPLLVDFIGEAFNLSPELATIIGPLAPGTALDPSVRSFGLPDLDRYHKFEHDASLSPIDFVFSSIVGDVKFDPAVLAELMSHFVGMGYIIFPVAAAARYSRVQSSRTNTSYFTYNAIDQITSYAKTAKDFRKMIGPTDWLTS